MVYLKVNGNIIQKKMHRVLVLLDKLHFQCNQHSSKNFFFCIASFLSLFSSSEYFASF